MRQNPKGGVYCIRNKINGKSYIGSTTSFQRRKREHLCRLRLNKHPNRHLQEDFNALGEVSFDFIVLLVVDNQSDLKTREQYYIDTIKETYNICPTADGSKLSEETKRLMSKSLSGENSTWYGKKHTKEYCEMMSMHTKGIHAGAKNPMFGRKGADNPRSKAVVCIDTAERFVSAEEAGARKGCSASHIRNCCKGTRNKCGGYRWKYAD